MRYILSLIILSCAGHALAQSPINTPGAMQPSQAQAFGKFSAVPKHAQRIAFFLPMTTVTLVADLGMAAMAAAMLLLQRAQT